MPAATILRLAPDGRITAAHRYKYLFLALSRLSSSYFTLSPTAIPSPTLGLSLTSILTASHHHLLHIIIISHSHSHFPSSHLHLIFTRFLQSRNQLRLATANWDSNGIAHVAFAMTCSTTHSEPRSNRSSMPPATSRASAQWSFAVNNELQHPNLPCFPLEIFISTSS